ncbi:class I SAM-dependent methyltransferase [Cellulomonas shaoxiangyii]|uniref:Class I SAM-dependent methyltransferase n=1 Tax=Cellulomonas shaoxiangyii TaxID=2566013 RepID=A0A4P7SMM9_9CELL|nr:class I SAM-dependent methyltransferase [Cellulomonas shaoxiangyii]QCB94486.1 class I SAM-dependent methyltransferase [Cellulomonas shaoxiangyii]TGY86068.1 class I SAM-dependent methyltransferase [Cellulomonas shaoxiangyii]
MDGRRLGWRTAYELLALRVRRPEWAFMNYGYAPAADDDGDLALSPADEPDRLCINLYERTIDGVDLTGRDVLEVGSGRGGGSAYVARTHGPRSVVGLDFSAAAVDLSRRHRTAPGLTFVHGDAQAMPFPDASFDAVLNVESSHCYPSLPAFLGEVRRVLRPGGVLLLADFRPTDAVPGLLADLRASGLTLVDHADVTPHVVAALRRDDTRKRALIGAWLPRVVHPLMRRFAAVEGSRGFAAFASGRTTYLVARLTAPTPGTAP